MDETTYFRIGKSSRTISQSYLTMAKNPQFHGRAEHIDIHFHFVQEQVGAGTVELMMKGLSSNNFEKLRKMASVTPIPVHFAHK